MDSKTDLSELDQLDFSELQSWCARVGSREGGILQMTAGDLGRRIIPGEAKYTAPEMSDLSKASPFEGKFLSDLIYAFILAAYVMDTSAPNILPKEVDITKTPLFLMTTGNTQLKSRKELRWSVFSTRCMS